jgi:hypothetical protein
MRLSVCRGEQRWVVEGPSERQQTTEGVRANGGSVSALPAQKAQRVGDWVKARGRAGRSEVKLLRQKAASFRVRQGARTTYPTWKADGVRWCYEEPQATRGGALRRKRR